jgi:thiosulfate/3-mercaptopyruvate sulfurtransferase
MDYQIRHKYTKESREKMICISDRINQHQTNHLRKSEKSLWKANRYSFHNLYKSSIFTIGDMPMGMHRNSHIMKRIIEVEITSFGGNMKGFKIGSSLVILLGILLGAGLACTNYTIPGKDGGSISANSCEGCHTDYERLIEVHDPDTAPPPGGCGGDAPHYEPYDRVYLGGSGYDDFMASGHYNIGCTNCHGGVGDTGDKYEAHSGDWTGEPSADYADNCGTCHKEITDNFTTSIHNGTGQKRKVAMRHGGSSSADWENLSEEHKAGYNQKCSTCHGTCGNCHITRPALGGGGLAKGHMFNGYEEEDEKLNMVNICITCHSSRGGHAFLGEHPDTEPDVHQQAGFVCLDCHDGHELHGDGEPVEQRYAYSDLPNCENCHGDLSGSNDYHSKHYDDFSCYVCHSQDYNNCGQCHIGGEGALIGHYQDFKLAINPIPDVKSGYNSDVTLVRRTLAWQENWKEYGVEEYANFDVFPTYNYTTPHNILKWTSRTEGDVDGMGCNTSDCHLKVTATDTVNKELYLFKSDLLEWEMQATEWITMDEHIPERWKQN